jgi:hypothetical protein
MIRNDRWIRFGGASGIALVVIYITATVVGAALRPGYSHIRDSVSELIEVGAPNKALLDTMISSYHLMLIMFAYGLHLALPRTRWGWLGPTLLGVAGFLGIILTAFFPCEVGCEANPTTLWGKGHGVLVAISALFVFTGMVALSWRMHQNPAWSPYARYTLVSALATLGLGLATIPLLNTDYTGLGERLALIPIYLWFVAIGLRLWRSPDTLWTVP